MLTVEETDEEEELELTLKPSELAGYGQASATREAEDAAEEAETREQGDAEDVDSAAQRNAMDAEAELERLRGLDHVARMQLVVLNQQAVHNRILAKSNEQVEAKEPQALHRAAAAHSQTSLYYYDGDPMQMGRFNSTRMTNACSMANLLGVNKARTEKCHRRRRQNLHDEFQKGEVVRQKHEANDERVRLRQQELVERQEKKTIVAQQKRGEQQKILHEVQKKQDQDFEKLQQKHYPAGVPVDKPNIAKHEGQAATSEQAHKASSSTSRPSTSPATGAQPRASSSPLSRGVTPEVASQPCYRKMVESHKLYSSTLGKWRGFVEENEKRTEAYWLKMLDGESRTKHRTVSKANLRLFKKTATNIGTTFKFLKSSTTLPDLDSNLGEVAAAKDGPDWKLEGLDSTLTSPGVSQVLLSSTPPRASPEVYAARLERVKSHQLALDQQAQEKGERDQQYLEEKRRLQRNQLQQRSGKLKDYNHAWVERNEAGALRREKLNVSSDADMMQKLADIKQKQDEMQVQRDEENSSLSASKQLKIQMTQEAARQNLENKTQSYKAKLDDRAEQNTNYLKSKFEVLNVAVSQQTIERSDSAKTTPTEKRPGEQAFLTQSSELSRPNSTEKDRSRPLNKTPHNPMQAFDRYRELRKDKGVPRARETPLELVLSPTERTRMNASFTLHDLCDDDAGGMLIRGNSFGGTRRLSGQPLRLAAVVQTEAASDERSGTESHRSSVADEEAAAHEMEFLTDLESRAKNWLRQDTGV